MTGENFKRMNRNTEAKKLKEEILKLKEQCGTLYQECRETGDFNSLEHERLAKEIARLEYYLWGARNGILI